MPLIDTTFTVDTSLYLKANLANNMVGDNWYLENLQEKRNQDWEYRYNVIDIEEETNKQCEYTQELPCYTPIEAVIQTVKDDKHNAVGDDWASLSFKDLKHPNNLGGRYRFDFSYEGEGLQDLHSMTEEEKYYNTSIWIAVNKSSIKSGNSLVVRRCNTSIALVGSPTREYNNITEVRYEPAILDNEIKLINMLYSQAVAVPQASWYITLQMNYFTNFIKINDRMVLGGTDLECENNNTVFKVKAIIKTNSTRTFAPMGSDEVQNIPIIMLGLDRDVIDAKDDLYKRIAVQSPIYPVKIVNERNETPEDKYIIEISEPDDIEILLGQTMYKKMQLVNCNNIRNANFNFERYLEGVENKDQEKYFKFDIIEDENGYINGFCIKNLRQYNNGYLIVKCICNAPDINTPGVVGINPDKIKFNTIEKEFKFILGGFY